MFRILNPVEIIFSLIHKKCKLKLPKNKSELKLAVHKSIQEIHIEIVEKVCRFTYKCMKLAAMGIDSHMLEMRSKKFKEKLFN